jgi:hypothetical protein
MLSESAEAASDTSGSPGTATSLATSATCDDGRSTSLFTHPSLRLASSKTL